jgi:alcohol dehydrogenase (cytochrome c)
VSKLKVAWVHQANGGEAHETSPIVVDGVMFITEAPNVVKSLDAKTGNVFWTYPRPFPTIFVFAAAV